MFFTIIIERCKRKLLDTERQSKSVQDIGWIVEEVVNNVLAAINNWAVGNRSMSDRKDLHGQGPGRLKRINKTKYFFLLMRLNRLITLIKCFLDSTKTRLQRKKTKWDLWEQGPVASKPEKGCATGTSKLHLGNDFQILLKSTTTHVCGVLTQQAHWTP